MDCAAATGQGRDTERRHTAAAECSAPLELTAARHSRRAHRADTMDGDPWTGSMPGVGVEVEPADVDDGIAAAAAHSRDMWLTMISVAGAAAAEAGGRHHVGCSSAGSD